MFDVEQLPALRELIRARAGHDRAILDRLIDQVRRARKEVRTIRPTRWCCPRREQQVLVA
jgi:hypothetical protein